MLPSLAVCALAVGLVAAPAAQADNHRLNQSVIANIYTAQRQAGCPNEVTPDPRLQWAAEWHTRDLMGHRDLSGDIGSDGSSPQQRGESAGYRGLVAQTVAVNPALAISGIELINKWYHDPHSLEIMRNCRNIHVGVWSENSLDRTVVVAVYGQPG